MTRSIEQLVEQAGRLAGGGRWDEAEQVWLEVRRREPQHPRALFSLGVHALKRGDGAGARALLTEARELQPNDLLVLMTLCGACQHVGDRLPLVTPASFRVRCGARVFRRTGLG